MDYKGAMIINSDTARIGNSYSSVLQPVGTNWRRCALACAQDPVCSSFSYSQLGVCSLNDNTPSTTALPGATSGTKWSL
jgi:hypothetical protein